MRPIGDKLVIATHNPGKLREIAALIEPLGISVFGAEELGLPEPEEIGNSFADKVTNAMNAGAIAAIIYNNVDGEIEGVIVRGDSNGRAWASGRPWSDAAQALAISVA